MADIFWVGADGNLYFKGAQGVQNWGSSKDYNLGNGGIQASSQSSNPQAKALGEGSGFINATQIADPNAPKAPANPTGTTSPALNTGAVANTQGSIDQIPGLLQAALAAEDQTHTNSNNTFNAQETAQNASHDAGTVTNQQNYDANTMASVRSGIQGLGGLLALLRGSGAAGGTAEDQVKDVVGGQTSDDIRSGSDTQKANQTSLDSALSTFLTDLKGKRQANDDTYTNNLRSINRDSETQLQDLYSKMAGYYSDAGRTAEANDFTGRAGALTPQIAGNTKTQVSAYDTTPVAVQAPQVQAFAAPTQPNIVAAPSDGTIGSGIFTLNKRKDDSVVPIAAAQGA